jgi:hypothetical protein
MKSNQSAEGPPDPGAGDSHCTMAQLDRRRV